MKEELKRAIAYKGMEPMVKLYSAVAKIGEVIEGELHIIDNSNTFEPDGGGEFRVYHKAGYCFDVKREYICEPEEVDQYDDVYKDGFSYSVFDEWDGFKTMTVNRYIKLITTGKVDFLP